MTPTLINSLISGEQQLSEYNFEKYKNRDNNNLIFQQELSSSDDLNNITSGVYEYNGYNIPQNAPDQAYNSIFMSFKSDSGTYQINYGRDNLKMHIRCKDYYNWFPWYELAINDGSIYRKLSGALNITADNFGQYVERTFQTLVGYLTAEYQMVSFISVWNGNNYGHWTVYMTGGEYSFRAIIYYGAENMFLAEYILGSTPTVSSLVRVLTGAV